MKSLGQNFARYLQKYKSKTSELEQRATEPESYLLLRLFARMITFLASC
jgi:hypothetical protein